MDAGPLGTSLDLAPNALVDFAMRAGGADDWASLGARTAQAQADAVLFARALTEAESWHAQQLAQVGSQGRGVSRSGWVDRV